MSANSNQENNNEDKKAKVSFLMGVLKRPALFFILSMPVIFLFLLYMKLLISPISLQIFEKQLNEIVINSLPADYEVKIENVSLALIDGIKPVVRFSPIVVYDKKNSSKVEMEAALISFSALKAIVGKPGLNVTLVAPQIKIIQDLHGARLGDFELIQEESGKNTAIWVLEGSNSFPSVNITSKGLDTNENLPKESQFQARSDNDLMIANFLAMNSALVEFSNLSSSGKISSLRIKNGHIDLHDSAYGFFRQFKNIDFYISQKTKTGEVSGNFSTKIANRLVEGNFSKIKKEEGKSRLTASLTNLDFASLLSFLDDPNSLVAVKGAGKIKFDVGFIDEKLIETSKFYIEPVNTNIRIKEDLFPLELSEIEITWSPKEAKLSLKEASVKVGQSFANIGGEFLLGFDKNFGPTVSISIKANDVNIFQKDLNEPKSAFEEVSFSGWSAPLYGAVGIDQIVAQKKDGGLLWAEGRADFLLKGMGIDVQIKGNDIDVDDLKRLWPYFVASDARNWLVQNAKEGTANSLDLRFNFPAGSLPEGDEELNIPKDAIKIDVVGENIKFIPWNNLNIVEAEGIVDIKVRDYVTTASIESGKLKTSSGNVVIKNAAVIIDGIDNMQNIFEISGDAVAPLSAIIDVAKLIIPKELEQLDIPMDIDSFEGNVNGSGVFTISVPNSGLVSKIDYAINGTLESLTSSEKIGGYSFANADFNFSLNQLGYNLNGKAEIAEFNTNVNVTGELNGEQKVQIFTELDIKQIKEFGIDLSEFLDGPVKFIVVPLKNKALQLVADLKDISINISDLGIKKPKGNEGRLSAIILQEEDLLKISNLSVAFDDVKVKGDMLVNRKSGFQTASFSTFTLSKNDIASLTAEPIKGGIALKIRGKIMDLKPILRRSFSLEQPSDSGVKSSQYQNTLLLDIKLKQAIGFYGVVGNNFDLSMQLKGSDLQKVSLQTQFSENNAVSIATNPTQNGRTMSVAFDDAGTLLRFLNIYSRLTGGKGSVVFAKDVSSNTDDGKIFISDFSLIDENKVTQIIGQDIDSRKLIANKNQINFKFGKASFIRKKGSIEIIDGVLDGGEVGGILNGFIHTTENEYDLTGTYIPLFGLNSIFQKIPLFGVILGGKEGEGLIGVTFAVRGKLNDPQFIINPVSLLAPGMFRSLFEFRAREGPVTQ